MGVVGVDQGGKPDMTTILQRDGKFSTSKSFANLSVQRCTVGQNLFSKERPMSSSVDITKG